MPVNFQTFMGGVAQYVEILTRNLSVRCVRTPSNAFAVSLRNKLNPYCSQLVGPTNAFQIELHKQAKHNQAKINKYELNLTQPTH